MKFGEVALQPPELTAKPKTGVSRSQVSGGGGRARLCRRACSRWTRQGSVTLPLPEPKPHLAFGPQPGKKSLMLGVLLSPGSVSQPPATSLARQRIVAEERARVVQAYRALKKLQQRPLGAQ